MFDFIIIFTTVKDPNKGAVVKLHIEKRVHGNFFLSEVIYGVTPASELNFLFASLHKW